MRLQLCFQGTVTTWLFDLVTCWGTVKPNNGGQHKKKTRVSSFYGRQEIPHSLNRFFFFLNRLKNPWQTVSLWMSLHNVRRFWQDSGSLDSYWHRSALAHVYRKYHRQVKRFPAWEISRTNSISFYTYETFSTHCIDKVEAWLRNVNLIILIALWEK